jgi:hypothetical protein
MPSFTVNTAGEGLRKFWRRAAMRELLLWCLPALICGGLLRALLLIHFPYGYMHPDTQDFLVTSDRWLRHHRVVLHGKKAFLGPILFLLPMLVRIPSLIFFPWAQHLFGLIYVVMTGALVRLWTTRWKWWIIPATVLAAINPAPLYYEHALIAESQYLWCVTALVLAGAVYATAQTRGHFILLLAALLLTAGSRPEGKLYVLFCLILVPLALWGHWRTLLVYGGVTVAFCLLTWMSSRNTQAGLLVYATLLPLAPETPKSAPDFGPRIAPMREARLARGELAIPRLVQEEKDISGVVAAYLKAKKGSTEKIGGFCQRLAIEAAEHKPWLLPVFVVEKFLQGTVSPDDDGFGQRWLQVMQIRSCTCKKWMLGLMPRLTGRDIETDDQVAAYVRQEFQPIRPDWFQPLQRGWQAMTTGARIPLPLRMPKTPGFPLFYLSGLAGMAVAIVRPGPMQKVHFAWLTALGFTAAVVMLTGVVNPRYRFVFEPFVLLYIFVLADALCGSRRAAPREALGTPERP